ncbi:MAG TPA: HIT domain-containing protein [Thermoanaerobaculia bacterium]|jgi:ATP adenylyltransferase|nr:HIT domain-containing protein [Thermoanaerobaculia bacterium]
MEVLFTPWRASYLTGGGPDVIEGCLFCELQKRPDDEALIVFRGTKAFVVMNRYPYTNGHLMVTPFAHHASLAEMTPEERHEMIDLGARCEAALRAEYAPHGFNLGLNLGKSAGAGVPGHAHLHVVPRWDGDTNFMAVVAETRTVPEELGATYARIKTRLAGGGA